MAIYKYHDRTELPKMFYNENAKYLHLKQNKNIDSMGFSTKKHLFLEVLRYYLLHRPTH